MVRVEGACHEPAAMIVQARLSAVQGARSHESSQRASPPQQDERRQQQQQQQHQQQQQQQQLDAASLPADLAAAVSAAAHEQVCRRAPTTA